MSFTRGDVFEKWGVPSFAPLERPEVLLSEVLKNANDTDLRGLWCDASSVHWDRRKLSAARSAGPTFVGYVGDGSWGNRVYLHAVPAIKVSDTSSHCGTHLVAQKKDGQWRARRLHVEEVKEMFDDRRVRYVVSSGDEGIPEYGSCCPARATLPYADSHMRFMRPGLGLVPLSVDEVISADSVQLIRGSMQLAGDDFGHRYKEG